MKRKLFGIAMLAAMFPFAAYSDGSGLAHIEHVGPGLPNLVYFTMQNAPNQPADCRIDFPRYVFSLLDPGGKEMYSLLLAAEVAGKAIYVRGKGTCNLNLGYEDVGWIRFVVNTTQF